MVTSYGVFPSKLQAQQRQRQRMNVGSMFISLFVPWILFCVVFADMTFFLHYASPVVAWCIAGGAGLFVAVLGASSVFSVLRRGDRTRNPTWLIFVFVTCFLALGLGLILGNVNYWTYTQSYYDLKLMNNYSDVNPSTTYGQQVMDAGQISFTNNVVLDLKLAMGFKNKDVYCVAPVTVSSSDGPTPLASYDFWVVGINCCDHHTASFRCGPYDSTSAHAGLRVIHDEVRPFFRLAVQEAEAVHSLKAIHPLFLFWSEDTSADLSLFLDEGYKWYYVGVMVHFGFQLFCVALAANAFAVMSHS
jgi:hypothetical protein